MILLTCKNVTLFPGEKFGISRFNLQLRRGKRYCFILQNEDQKKTFMGLLEGRFQPQSGFVEREKKLFSLLKTSRICSGKKRKKK